MGLGSSENDGAMTGYTVTNRVTFGHATKKQSRAITKSYKNPQIWRRRFGFNLFNAFFSVFFKNLKLWW